MLPAAKFHHAVAQRSHPLHAPIATKPSQSLAVHLVWAGAGYRRRHVGRLLQNGAVSAAWPRLPRDGAGQTPYRKRAAQTCWWPADRAHSPRGTKATSAASARKLRVRLPFRAAGLSARSAGSTSPPQESPSGVHLLLLPPASSAIHVLNRPLLFKRRHLAL